jgi:RecT family
MNALTMRGATSLAPQNMAEAMKFSELLAHSDMVPKDFRGKPANVLVAVQWGYEVGLGPLQALQNIAIINGRPSIWGDVALALVRGHPACEAVREGVEGEGDGRAGFCEVKRKGQDVERRTFSVADAKRAGLWGKQGPWQQYPDRMLQLRARGFAIRDVFPDALRGVITAEEAQDMPTEPREVQNMAAAPVPRPAPAVVVDETEYEWLTMQGKAVSLRRSQWLKALERALASLEDARAVMTWRGERGHILAAVADAGDDDLAGEAQRAIDLRLAALTEGEE